MSPHRHPSPSTDPVHAHKTHGPKSARCLVVTVSDTRTLEDDTSGARAAELLAAAGHVVVGRRIVRDEPARIADEIEAGVADPGTDAIVLSGGTGIAPRDVTFETVSGRLDKSLDGFGELFRMLSYEEIGSAAMLSRAVAGVIGKTAVFAVPGSSKGVALAIEKLIAPELGHIAGLLHG